MFQLQKIKIFKSPIPAYIWKKILLYLVHQEECQTETLYDSYEISIDTQHWCKGVKQTKKEDKQY